MRAVIFIVFITLFSIPATYSQSFAFIDSDYILGSIPEYTEAKEKLDKLAENWTKDIEERFNAIKTQKEAFNKEEILLPAEEKEKRKTEIEKLEKETIDLQTQRFGLNGDYFMKRQELIKPIQDRIYTSMKKVAKADGYTFVFDKTNQSNLIYADKDADISNRVLEEMGINKE
ncbi:MAG: OmpH family outer membrane protein [Flavobacteriia bacterium]|jgi:outer membrane protein|nr:OmpH family outer membrane protein [Flavobacteriia bacterium]NBV68767.1 OmpH family outer membrane protein [Flavobacteriia bacterium]NBY39373.1 OmpH family outer membrane protein [Flavobacteriia bacterium]